MALWLKKTKTPNPQPRAKPKPIGARLRAVRQGAKKGDADYGQGEHCIAAEEHGLYDTRALTRTLLDKFNAPGYQPPSLPAAAMEIMQLAGRPDVSVREVVRLLEQDQVLAGRVLQIAQSAFYGPAQVRSLKEAVIRMGIRTLRDVVMEAALKLRVFRCKRYAHAMELLRDHSTQTAHVARVVCRFTPIEGEYAFIAGLLHDVGIAVALLVLGEMSKNPPELRHLWPTLEEIHEEVGGILCRAWKLPEDLALALSHHHRLTMDGYVHPLAAVVLIADLLAIECGAPERPPEVAKLYGERGATPAIRIKKAKAAAGITEQTMALIRKAVDEALNKGE